MVKHKIIPLPDASVGKVLGLVEVIYSYGGQSKISFLSDELRLPIDELGNIVDMAELFNLVKVADGVATLTIYGEALNLGTIEDKKKILRKKISSVEPFKTVATVLGQRGEMGEEEVLRRIMAKYPVGDKEKFHRLFVGWGTYAQLFEYDSGKHTFSVHQAAADLSNQ